MSDSTSRLPVRPSVEHLSKQAKELLRQCRSGERSALDRFSADLSRDATLADAQFVIAREYGFETWAKLKHHIEAIRPPGVAQFEELAQALAQAYSAADATALRKVNSDYGTSFLWEHEAVDRQRLALQDTQDMVAHLYGFANWIAFAASFRQEPANPRSAPVFLSSRPPFYKIDWKDNRLTAKGPQSDQDWDAIFALMKKHGIAELHASGMSDAVIKRLLRLDHLTGLDIGGSKAVTDEGVLHLAPMTQLRVLTLGGRSSPITDRGLAVLRHLPELRRFEVGWTQKISDDGLGGLSTCEHLEEVNLIGTPSGDGAIGALTGKPGLRRFRAGCCVTDRGIALLHQFPLFKTWHSGEIKYSLMSANCEPNFLMLDGPFTDAGLAGLAGLDGLFVLSFFWHCSAFTSTGLEPLKHLANLGFLGCQGRQCDNQAMRHIATIPRLRMLMAQGTIADDDGFEALSRSPSIEYIWGRECPNLGSQGFKALASMPALKGIAVSCKNVDDAALSTLPRFPALRHLMPMDVPDAGFRHIGRCENLEGLWCMYCRDTGDTATEHIGGLKRLKTYYAGHTRITDRSLKILGSMDSLESLTFWRCPGLTDVGIANLASLPNLREVTLEGLPGVTKNVLSVFAQHVRINFTA